MAETWGEDIELALTEVAWQLADLRQMDGGRRKILASLLLPASLPTLAVVDQLVAAVQVHNAVSDPDWLISTLRHEGAWCRLSIFVVETY